jgi:hypothetical protein
MTLAEAERIVGTRRLRFGDLSQLEAVKFLENFEVALRIAKSAGARICIGCKGSGDVRECGGPDAHDECDDECWSIRCDLCEGIGVTDGNSSPIDQFLDGDIDDDVLAQLIATLRAVSA